MKKWKAIAFATLLLILGLNQAASRPVTSPGDEDWGTYPHNYKELAQKWLSANVFQPDSVLDLQIGTPGRWWQRQSILKGGKTSYGYRVIMMFTPKKQNGARDKKQIHNLHIRNGEVIDDWKDNKEAVAVRGETPEIQVHELGVMATQENGEDLSWLLIANLKEAGSFKVTATTPLDRSLSTTFACSGPGKFTEPFFARQDFPSLWSTGKASGSQWFLFHFDFEDTASDKRFELDQWTKIDFRDLDKITAALKKEKKKFAAAAKSTEQVKLDFDGRDWQPGYSHAEPNQEIIEYILPAETVDNWTELVTVQSFPGAQSRMTPEQTMIGAKEVTLQQCPSAMWQVVHQDKNDILYEWQTTDCPGTDNEYEIARIIKGKTAIFRIAYACKNLPISASDRTLWLELLGKARLSDGT